MISAGLIYLILRDTNLEEVFNAITSANLLLVGLAVLSNVVGLLISAFRWQILMRAQSVEATIPFLLKSYLVSGFFNNFLPSTMGGDAVRAYDSWRLGQTKSGAVAVVFVDRFLGLLVLMAFALVAALVTPQIVDEAHNLHLWVGLGAVGAITAMGIMFVPSQALPNFIERLPLPFKTTILKIVSAFLAFQGKTSVLLKALALSVLLQANVVLHYFLVAEALNLGVPFLNFFLIIPLASFIMMLPISINAIGVREGVFAFFFAPFGVLRAEAVAFAWIVYGIIALQGVVGGVLYALRR
ncbi:MAG: lysylphosphatidylglycerol synthase transmembrane domain-containing protein [Aggregatilineales bacterium]